MQGAKNLHLAVVWPCELYTLPSVSHHMPALPFSKESALPVMLADTWHGHPGTAPQPLKESLPTLLCCPLHCSLILSHTLPARRPSHRPVLNSFASRSAVLAPLRPQRRECFIFPNPSRLGFHQHQGIAACTDSAPLSFPPGCQGHRTGKQENSKLSTRPRCSKRNPLPDSLPRSRKLRLSHRRSLYTCCRHVSFS